MNYFIKVCVEVLFLVPLFLIVRYIKKKGYIKISYLLGVLAILAYCAVSNYLESASNTPWTTIILETFVEAILLIFAIMLVLGFEKLWKRKKEKNM